ncbi:MULTISPECIES: FecR family protein [Butyricimonas]|uniref:FecR family protein n=1 Tax=Butyricimonas TaxID=574697 RepID=UPI0007FB2A1A|nr:MULTISPECIES: FecR family protein [Butyricimonas]
MMDYNKEKILAEIILKIRFGTASKEEKREVEKWMAEKEEHRLLYEKIVSGKSMIEYLETETEVKADVNVKMISARVQKQIRENKMRTRRGLRKWYAMVGAACLVGIVLAGFFFLNNGKDKPDTLVENKPERMMNEKVMLVLSDGKTIGLAHQGTDSIYIGQATIIKKDAQLTYERKQDTLGAHVEEERNRIITTVGGDYFFILSDGTKVWLNAESELDFPVDFIGEERVVKLKGEAYFEVEPDAAHPFIVETKEVRTRVLGTSFNIKAYDNEESVYTTLLTGKVEVSAVNENESVILTSGMQCEWEKDEHVMEMKKVDAEKYVAWKQGQFMFDNENITVVTRVLERWYGLKFIYNEGCSRKHTFSGCLSKDDSLESILETLTYTGGPRFIMGKNVVYVKDKI